MHENQKAQRFHRDRLAPRVRACNEENAVVATQDDRVRHDNLRVDERMTGLQQPYQSALRYIRPAGFHLLCQLSLGKDKFQLSRTQGALIEIRIFFPHLRSQTAEDLFDFPRFANTGCLQVIIGINDGHRFNIERRATGRCIMDNAGKSMAVLLLDGNDVAVVTNRNEDVLKIFLIFFTLENALHVPLRLPFELHNPVAQAQQLW